MGTRISLSSFAVVLLTAMFLLLAGCGAKKTEQVSDDASAGSVAASTSSVASEQDELDDSEFDDDDFLDDSEFDPAHAASSGVLISDPIEPWNRFWFGFNDFFYLRIARPAYDGYEAVVHEDIRSGLSNAWKNIQAPVRIVNSILQFEFAQAVVEFGRFMVNSTVGGLGLAEIIPPEKSLVPLSLETANFGGTLAKWGFGEGFYIVWPVLGPSTLRDTFGIAGDTASGIPFWITDPIGPVNAWATTGPAAGFTFNDMGTMLKTYESLTKVAIEPYSAVRDAYVKQRRGVLSQQPSMPGQTAEPVEAE